MVIKIFFKEIDEITRKSLGFRWLKFYGKRTDYFEVINLPGVEIFVHDAGHLYLHCVTDEFLIPELGPLQEYIDHYQAQVFLPKDCERSMGYYEHKTAKGRYSGNAFYVGGTSLRDIEEFCDLLFEGVLPLKKEYPKKSLTRSQLILRYLGNLESIGWIKSFFLAFRLANVHTKKIRSI